MKIREITEDLFKQNFHKINAIVTQQHSDVIRKLLVEMFPKYREIIDLTHRDEVPFSDWRRFIYEIDQWVLTGPVVLQASQIPPNPREYELELEKMYNQYVQDKEAGRPARYFRQDDADPRTIDFSKLPPITIARSPRGSEIVDGNHRAFLAKKARQPLKSYVWNNTANNHPNVAKIKSLFAEIDNRVQ